MVAGCLLSVVAVAAVVVVVVGVAILCKDY